MDINPKGNALTEWLNSDRSHQPPNDGLDAPAPANFNRFPAGSGPSVMPQIKGTKATLSPNASPINAPIGEAQGTTAPNTGPIAHSIMDKQVSDNTDAFVF